MNKETARILALPVRETPEVVPDLTPLYRREGGTQRLRPIQSLALAEIERVGGLLGPIGVGHGKTVVTLLAPSAASRRLGRPVRALLLVPASLYQKTLLDAAEYAEHWELPPLEILPYSQLSQPESSRILEQPFDLIIADEAHKLRNLDSARTRRVGRFFEAHPDARLVALSGTLTSKSVLDYAHLAEWALGAGSPLPLHWTWLRSYSAALDVDPVNPPGGHDIAAVEPLARDPRFATGGPTALERRRRSYHRRLTTTPGVVATKKASVDCALYLERLEVTQPEDVQDALAHLELLWETPCGDVQLESAMRKAEVARQLTQGFYYRWVWPDGTPDRAWLSARSAWAVAVREALQRSRPGLDSPALLARACEAGEAPTRTLAEAWEAWSVERAKPEPPVETVWVSDYLLADVWRWLHQDSRPRIVWYSHGAIEERLRAVGLPVYGSGDEPPREAETCAMSIAAHGTGRNLQAWAHQLVICPPSSGAAWEQLLGRTHRAGQTADAVWCAWYGGGVFDSAMHKAVESARYIAQTQGQRMKLLLATTVGDRR